jgi:monoterpene epsilon-lactone hydrolase
MQSIRSRFFIFLLKHRHWFHLKLKSETIDWNTSIPHLRQRVERSSRMFGRLPSDIEVLRAPIDNPTGEFIKVSGVENERVILYFHGGGYVMGSSSAHRTIVAKFVKECGINALTFDYRLAPEHPFPAALNDSVNVYRWLLSQRISPPNTVFIGDSAGGGLCLATLLSIRDQKTPLPGAAVVLSPWTDLKCTGDSYHRKDPLAPQGSWKVFGKYYAGDHDRSDPLISPLYGDLRGLPPLFISVGENENLLDDSRLFAERAKHSGVETTLRVGEGMVHCYPTLSPPFPEAKQALKDICIFINSNIGKA